ncbi:MAG: endonuclease [Prevotella sp.]|nr:endonuclease [Prevotella sp.]
MSRRIFSITLLLVVVLMSAWAQGPNSSGTYYSAADGKCGEALKTALYGIIKSHTSIGYDNLYESYRETDTRSDGYVRDWYSNTTNYTHVTDKAGSYSAEGDCYNREHSVPQSWYEDYGNVSTIKCDIVHVIPTDGYVNNRRGNYPLAEVGTASYTSNNSYCKLGSCSVSGYSGTVFEPNDEIKGDMARIYFYMATCYEDYVAKWAGNATASAVFDGTTYPAFKTWYLDMLMRWSKEDPVDAVEIARNNAVYGEQENRNPFVDYPGLEDYVWGDKTSTAFSYDNYDGTGTSTTVATPTFSPAGGTYTTAQTVTISCSTSGATIYYTLDGSTPTSSSSEYSSPITISETTTLMAIAIANGESSSVKTATYTINESGGETTGDGTFIFNTDEGLAALGLTKPQSGNGTNITTSLVSGGVTLSTTDGSTETRVWNSNGTTDLRVYKNGGSVTLSSDAAIVKIEFTTPDLSLGNIGVDNGVWTGESKSVTFTATATTRISTITVTLQTESTKEEVSMSFSPEIATATIGEDFTEPTLTTNPSGLTVTYTSSNESVATVNSSSGEVTLIAAGETTITATFAGDDAYNSGSASYLLTVEDAVIEKEDVTMSFSLTTATATIGEDFTEPTLTTDPTGLTVIYSSSNEQVATVDSSTGDVTLVASGETTITATFAGNDSYNSGSASYVLTVNNATTSGETLLWESFSGYTLENDGSTDITPSDTNLDYDNWNTFTKVYYGGNACGKMSSGSANGTMSTNSIELAGKGTLTFSLKKFKSDNGSLALTVDGATLDASTFTPTSSTDWMECTVNLTNASGSITLTFAATKRLYIDDIKLVSANEEQTLVGDVNKDGDVTIADVTALVNIILGKATEGDSNNYDFTAADVNTDDEITIADVTALVNIILNDE